jgi:hypothetical protein
MQYLVIGCLRGIKSLSGRGKRVQEGETFFDGHTLNYARNYTTAGL